MKIALYLLLAAPVLFLSRPAEARNRHTKTDLLDQLNQNSIYRNNDQVFVRAHHDHKVYSSFHKDTSEVVVKDANGNIQASKSISVTNNDKPNNESSLFSKLKNLFSY